MSKTEENHVHKSSKIHKLPTTFGDESDLNHKSHEKSNKSWSVRTRASLMRTSAQIKREAMRTVYALKSSEEEISDVALGYGDCQVSFRSFACLQPECLSLWERLAIRASPPQTSHKEIIRRSAFMLISILTVGSGAIWSLFYFIVGERTAAVLPLAYSALVSTSLYSGVARREYQSFVFVQLTLILTFPFIVHMVLGGFQESGGVMLWSFLSPLGAAFFRSAEESNRWFGVHAFLSAFFLIPSFQYYSFASITISSSMELVKDLFFATNILGVTTVVFMATRTFAKELEREYERSERLLHNILPSTIARRIKEGEVPIVDRHKEVTILFADIVGFTSASTRIHPDVLIGRFLRDFFASTDELVDVRGLEKIKTIGDAYMVVGGLFKQEEEGHPPPPNESEHAVEVIDLAAEMFGVLEKVNRKHGLNFQIRIGIHTGPVIAGVLGVKKFAYDVWGDAVNTASRMESNGKPSYIHLSQQAYDKVHHLTDRFQFSNRGESKIKGKGTMVTYLAHPIKI